MTEEQLRQMASDLQAELRKAFEDRVDPTDAKVRELEARLAETQEEIRLAKTNPAMGGGQGNEGADFRGIFLKNEDAIRSMIVAAASGDTRAIDTSLLSSGGKLSADQAATFLDWVVAEQVALSRVQTRRMMSSSALIEELKVAKRKLRAATENTAPSVAGAISTGKRSLSTTEVIWGEDITLSFLEDNIERRGAENHIARLLATQFGNDLNDLAWNGDTAAGAGADQAFLNINNGWLKIIAGESGAGNYDATSSTTARQVLREMMQLLPAKYKSRTDLLYFMPVAFCEQYADEIATRSTGLGDQVLVNGFPALRFFGMLVVPETALIGNVGTLTPAENLVFGIQRQMTVDSMYQPRKRAIEYTISARIDYEIAKDDAVVRGTNIPAALL